MAIQNPRQIVVLAQAIFDNEKRQRQLEDNGRQINHDLDGRICDQRAALEDVEDYDLNIAWQFAKSSGAAAVIGDEIVRRAVQA